jgi:hypothetical protein
MAASSVAQVPVPNPVGHRDVEVLIGWAAILEGEIVAGEVPPHLQGKLRRRLVDAGLLAVDGSERDLVQAINDINHRLRYTLGEYTEPPRSMPLP